VPVQMFDTTTVEDVPNEPQAVAGYVGGLYPTYVQLVERYPRAYHLSIAVTAEEDAECLDVERYDATPSEAPAWARRQLARGVRRPVLYASLSTMPVVLSLLRADGLQLAAVRIWTAHYTQQPHICGPACGFGLDVAADATQWTSSAINRNLDESLCRDTFFGPPPPPPDPYRYQWYGEGPFPYSEPGTRRIAQLNERAIVQEYDHLRVHPRMNARRLGELQPLITFLRKRVWFVAHFDIQRARWRPAPDWDSYHRGWRWQMLLARSRGELIAP